MTNGAIEEWTAARTPVESDEHSHAGRNGLLCALVLAGCVLTVYPVANMPFGDDFSYTKTALEFARTGHFHYNGWAAAMLGWMIPWGALFIKAFGFSFTILRLSVLPIAMATVYLFHDILRRFNINAVNSVLGALTMALTPLFLPMASTYMTDIPGLFVIVLCIYMCQRVVMAGSDRAAIFWLSSAMLVNMVGGTVRQLAWLGALVMVPSTAWLLRKRKGMKFAGFLLWVLSLTGVLVCLHWFARQPYSVPEDVYMGPIHPRMLVHMSAELLRAFLCLLLIVFPVSVAWLPLASQLTNKARLRFASAMVFLILVAIVLCRFGRADTWLMPWLIPLLETQAAGGVKIWMRIGISLLVIAPALILLEQLMTLKHNSGSYRDRVTSWNTVFWILGPFTLAYIFLLMPSATYVIVQDRYLLGLVPAAIVILLRLYQERVTTKLPLVSLVALTMFAVYSVAGAHSLFAGCRAIVRTVDEIQSSGVPRTLIQAGLASDGWIQIEKGGHINDSRIRIPAGAYNPNASRVKLPDGRRLWLATLTPAITPKYFLVSPQLPSFSPTKYPAVHYRSWLPPFDRTIYVQQLRSAPD